MTFDGSGGAGGEGFVEPSARVVGAVADGEIKKELAPLDRARQVRVNVICNRLGNVQRAASMVADWFAGLPVAVQVGELGGKFVGGIAEIRALVDQALMMARANQGEAPAAAQLRLISDQQQAEAFAELLQGVAVGVNRVSMQMLPLHVASETLKGRTGRAMLPFDEVGRQRLLDATSAAMLVDSRWVAGQAARLSSAALDPKQANVERVKRHRARQRAGFSAVTVHYHENDLGTLRELGFLHGSGPYSAADIAAAFEAFQQAALAMVASGDDDRGEEVLGIFHVKDAWGHWRIQHWANRLGALFGIGRR